MKPDPRIGSTFGNYRIDSMIGRGGMGVVYLAEQLGLARRVALKVVAPEYFDDPDFRRRFIREAHVAASIDHPSVIPVYDAGEVDDELYIAMRYVEGRDLHAVLRDGPVGVDWMLPVMTQAAGALDAAHAEGLVHRDVKPANILIERPRRPDMIGRVFLTDFGLTKRSGSSTTTQTGVFIGTVDYAAPEQLRTQEVDGRTDVYALGCVIFECLTGKPPFQRVTPAEVIAAHLMDAPPSVLALKPDLPPSLDVVLARALAKSKESRPPTCSALVREVQVVLEPSPGTSETRSFTQPLPTVETPVKEPSGVPRRRRLGWVVGVLAAVVLLGGAAAAALTTGVFRHHSAAPSVASSAASPSPTVSKRVDPATAPVIGTATITKDTNLVESPEAGGKVIAPLKKGDGVFEIGHAELGFYHVKLASDEATIGWVDKNDADIICPVQCAIGPTAEPSPPTPLNAFNASGHLWGVYVTVAPPGSPQLAGAFNQLIGLGLQRNQINNGGDLGCDYGASEALGITAPNSAAVAVYFHTKSDARSFVESAADVLTGPLAGIAHVTIGCND